jgi:predicted nucleotidyltransferase component of viral defense system
MLQIESVQPNTFAILKKLSALPVLSEFQLVGGTALALQIGHRQSIDLDFFTPNIDFDENKILRVLQNMGKTVVLSTDKNWLGINFEGVKIDILKYPYALLEEYIAEDGIRLISQADIAAMKLSAISSRGAKKDFFDLYFLLQAFTLGEMLDLYSKKFGIHEHFHVIRSLTYFDDAEEEIDPIMLQPISWQSIKKRIEKVVRDFLL